MHTYSVTVDSSGYSADWIDILIVMAETEDEARNVAAEYISTAHPNRTILMTEAYPLTADPARVVGRLINTDEE